MSDFEATIDRLARDAGSDCWEEGDENWRRDLRAALRAARLQGRREAIAWSQLCLLDEVEDGDLDDVDEYIVSGEAHS